MENPEMLAIGKLKAGNRQWKSQPIAYSPFPIARLYAHCLFPIPCFNHFKTSRL